jgi:alkanesulfonate monooxygenase SsuD/methylene tetrahydromethanopterin reductase-like flavin-dependent oxidoreductase (luciferase family)
MMGETLPTHQPVRVAEELAIIDCVSGGRLIAGMPVGTPMDTAINGGLPPTEIRPRFYEALDLIKEAWSRPGPFPFNGKFTQLRYVNPWPQPIQKVPPIWLAGGSSKETYEFAAQNDYMYSNLSLRGVDAAQAQLQQYWDCVEAAGLDDNPYRAGMILSVAVGDTDEEAEKLYSYHKTRFFQFAGHVPANLSAVPGYLTKDSLRGVVSKLGRVDYYKPPVLPTWKSLVDSGTVIAGSSDTVAERIYDICKTLRVGHLVVNLQTSTMPTELARHNAELFATRVMPRLRTLWQDTEYENKWWPEAADRSQQSQFEEVTR